MKGGLGRYRGRLISTGGTHVHGGSEAREKKERGIILRNIYPLSLFAKSSLPLEREREREPPPSAAPISIPTFSLSACSLFRVVVVVVVVADRFRRFYDLVSASPTIRSRVLLFTLR